MKTPVFYSFVLGGFLMALPFLTISKESRPVKAESIINSSFLREMNFDLDQDKRDQEKQDQEKPKQDKPDNKKPDQKPDVKEVPKSRRLPKPSAVDREKVKRPPVKVQRPKGKGH